MTENAGIKTLKSNTVAYFPRVTFDLSSYFRVPTRGELRLMI